MPLLRWLSDEIGRGGLLVRLVVDMCCVGVLIRVIYHRHYHRTELFFTFFSFNLVIFLLTSLLNRVEMTLGAAFGLFAVFSMLRYRTEGLSAKDMTYLFLVIAVGLLMAVGNGEPGTLLLVASAIPLCAFLLEGDWIAKRELSQQVWYENIALVHMRARAELIGDLRQRTGLDVHRVDVHEMDFLRDAARLTLYYRPR